MDPDSTVAEEPLFTRPDPWPGDEKHAGEVPAHGYLPFQLLFGIPPHLNFPGNNPPQSEIRGNASLLIRLYGIRATLQSAEQGPVEEVLWAETEREEVWEEARQRRQVYAE